ncbi:MAG: DUF4981 domain-containing protein [Candidatus Marinimicrobia bacterium]|nr:DUF4981 domain-containing protein [Candidatus Neomarinimicrobiota bacterium]MCF7829143.1 DUF4981 domain-containing protein [Candidatus Neomarinimicrobiota bacterium]MCF7881204.1 DUF4981 domain-containing protein [Candidatus Neomarinimicrobiota bacterium]
MKFLKGSFVPFLVIIFAFGHQSIQAQFSLAEFPDWENPTVIGINKEPAHAEFVPHPDIESALADVGPEYNSVYHQSLDGQWKFHWAENPAKRPVDFYREDFDVSAWAEITVPGTWQLQGYDYPIYANSRYPVESLMDGLKPPRAPREYNPVGSYRQTFTVPSDWEGRQTLIHFEGVKSAFYIWVNGQKVGYSEGSMTAAEFDLTPYLKDGENSLAVEVYRWSDGSWLEDQDMWRFSGIYRSVYLFSKPYLHLQDFFVRGGLDDEYRDGTLQITADVRNNTDDSMRPATVEVYLYDPDGNQVGDGPVATSRTQHGMASGVLTQAILETTIENPKKWTAETPNLYTVILVLKDSDGKIKEVARTNTGFREIEIRDKMFLVNGEEVKLKGTNVHDHDPVSGRTVRYEMMVKDVKLMKRHNLNAVRMAHYPHDRRYYDLFDKYGLYVIDEANVESHGISFRRNVLPGSDPLWEDAVLDRARSMVEANKNHPSVVIWSMGNEAGNGENIAQMASWVRTADPSRPIHYQHMNYIADMNSYMYPPVDGTQRIINDPEIPRPIILCEYVHSMGNSTGNLDEYMELMANNTNFIGAFIWDWVDQGLRKESEDGTWFWAYGGDYGDEPNDGNFGFNGVIFPDRTPQPALQKVKYSYQYVNFGASDLRTGRIWIANNYDFLNLNQFELRWSLNEDGKSIQSGTIDTLDVEPGGFMGLKLPIESPEYEPGREYWLNVSLHLKTGNKWADVGYKMAWEQMEMPYAVPAAPAITPDNSLSLQVNQTEDVVTVSNDNFEIKISNDDGALSKYEYGGNSLISGRLTPNFWRAMTDNDEAGWEDELDPWRKAGANRSVNSVEVTESGDNRAEVTVEGTIPVGETTFKTVYTILSNGAVQVDQTVTPLGADIPSYTPRIGMNLRIDKSYETMTWYGRGPYENYWDRKIGITVGEYSGAIDSLWVNYPYPQENGNRDDVRWAAFAKDDGTGFLAVAADRINVSVWPYTVEDLQEAKHINELPRREFYTVNLDYKQQGVGGTNSWSERARALSEYRLPTSESYNYTFYLQPYSKEMGELRDVANYRFPEE